MPTITIPHNFEPRWYQLPYLQSKARFKLLVMHRKSGKSMLALNEQVRKAISSKGIYYYLLPTYGGARRVMWDELIPAHIPPEVIDHKTESPGALAIFYKNGSIQRFVGCEKPDTHRGINPIDVVFDEYAEMKEEMWTAIVQPVLRQNMGTATFIFTPKGRNHAWRLMEQAKQDPDWYVDVKSVDDTKAVAMEELEKARKASPEALYRQEYLCEFLDHAGAFFSRVKENMHEADPMPIPGHAYQLGIDLAKYQDWTVITPFDLNTFTVLPQERFNRVDWAFQKARIEAVAARYNNARVQIDSTGVGDPIVEDLGHAGVQVVDNNNHTGYRFTEVSRRQLLDNLRVKIEQDQVKLPADDGLYDELASMAFTQTEQGKLKVQVPTGLTDDRIMSLALAVWGVDRPIASSKVEEYTLYKSDFS